MTNADILARLESVASEVCGGALKVHATREPDIDAYSVTWYDGETDCRLQTMLAGEYARERVGVDVAKILSIAFERERKRACSFADKLRSI